MKKVKKKKQKYKSNSVQSNFRQNRRIITMRRIKNEETQKEKENRLNGIKCREKR